MKYCPNCRTEYADETLQFCLQDGTPLAADYDTEAETVVAPKQVEPIHFEPPSSYQTNRGDWQTSQPVVVEQHTPKKSNTPMIVALSVLGTILLLGLGGAGAWLYFNNRTREVAVNVNAAPQNKTTNANAANQNANLATPSPSATPTAQPTLDPKAAKEITNDVKAAIDDWKDATENIDINAHMSRYADTVDYYKAGKVSVAKVRADREKAFAAYDSMNVEIKNVKVTPDPSGDKATVVLDKEWSFEGEEKYSSGEVQQQLTFARVGGRWLITGEKDLKVYRVEK